jgi:hypothetical protein
MVRPKLFPAVFLVIPAAAVLMTHATLVEAAPDECRAKPGASAPTGFHWYYRVDRVNQRRCWFLSSGDLRTRQSSSLGRRELISHSVEAGIAQQSELDDKIVAEPPRQIVAEPPRQEPVILPDEPTQRELAAPEFDALAAEGLVPHKVTTMSYVQPHAGEQSLGRGTNPDLVFLCGALATALLVAGAAFQVVGRIQQSPKARRPYPTPDQPDAGAERQKIAPRAAQHRPLPSRRTSRQGVVNIPLRMAQRSATRLQ